MAANIPATRGNLMALNRSLALARTGYELMDKKRNILLREIMRLAGRAKELQSEIDEAFARAYSSLERANSYYGVINSIASSVHPEDGVSVRMKSVVGVEVPSVRIAESEIRPPYGLNETTTSVDDAYIDFIRVKKLCVQMAETENAVYRLAEAIKKTRRRANALQNVSIPRLEANIKRITSSLEEKEREEFSRLKIIKK